MRLVDVAVIGSRTFADPFFLFEWLDDNVLHRARRIISGGARVGDTIAEQWANDRRWIIGCRPTIHHPDRSVASPRRYHERNTRIVNDCDELVAVWDGISRGTRSTIDKATRAGKRVTIVWFGPHQMRGIGAGPTLYVQGPQCLKTPPLIRLPMDRGKSRGRWWSICPTDVVVRGPGLPLGTSGTIDTLQIPGGLPTRSLGEFKAAYQDRLRSDHLGWPGNLYAVATETVWTNRDHLFEGMSQASRIKHRAKEDVRVSDGDSLVCTCDKQRVEEGKCHRVWAAEVLVEHGWRIILDGVELEATAPGRLRVGRREALEGLAGDDGLREVGGGQSGGRWTAGTTRNGGVADGTGGGSNTFPRRPGRETGLPAGRGARRGGRGTDGGGEALGHVGFDADAPVGDQMGLVDL